MSENIYLDGKDLGTIHFHPHTARSNTEPLTRNGNYFLRVKTPQDLYALMRIPLDAKVRVGEEGVARPISGRLFRRDYLDKVEQIEVQHTSVDSCRPLPCD